MAVFALVHGAWGGAWCWERLVPELEILGHDALAVDLPCEDVSAGCARYAEEVVAALAGAGDDVVVVGHSLGGLTIPLVAEARPVRSLVFLCALLPSPGQSFVERLAAEPDIFVEGFAAEVARDEQGRTSWTDSDAAIDALYHDCPEDVARRAVARLRGQARTPLREPCPLGRWPDVECRYVLARGDRAVAPDWSRRAARAQLGSEPTELAGGHSPYLARPRELAAVLAR